MGLDLNLFILRHFNIVGFLVAVDYIQLLSFKVNFILKFNISTGKSTMVQLD